MSRKGKGTVVDSVRVIAFLVSSHSKEAVRQQVFLRDILFCPAVKWFSDALCAAGIDEFLVVCPNEQIAQVMEYFPIGTRFVVPDESLAAQICSYAQEKQGKFLCFSEPVFLTERAARELVAKAGEGTGQSAGAVGSVSAEELENALKNGMDFYRTMCSAKGYDPCDEIIPLTEQQLLDAMGLQLRNEIIQKHQKNGVSVLDPLCTYIDPRVKIGAGTVILPGTILRGNTEIGPDCEIGPNSMITNCVVGARTTVNASQINESRIGDDTAVGPFAYIRPNCIVGNHVKVGDFVEVKNSVIGDKTKISHLTYVGDADLGRSINLGCGTVTVNYDGRNKYRTVVDDGAFVGCNTNLIAPVHIGEGAYLAAGGTITEDVPAGSLVIARSRQTVKLDRGSQKYKKK